MQKNTHTDKGWDSPTPDYQGLKYQVNELVETNDFQTISCKRPELTAVTIKKKVTRKYRHPIYS